MYDEGTLGLAVPVDEKNGHFGRSYPNHLNASSSSRRTFLGLSLQDRQDLAFLSPGQLYTMYYICRIFESTIIISDTF